MTNVDYLTNPGVNFIIYTLLIYCMLNKLWDCLAYYLSKS